MLHQSTGVTNVDGWYACTCGFTGSEYEIQLHAEHANHVAELRALVKRTCHTPLLIKGMFVAIDEEERIAEDATGLGYREQIAVAEEMLAALAFRNETLDMANEYLRKQQRVVFAIRDDARAASARDLEARRRAWDDGVQACIDLVKRRHEHYEMYRCDCLDRDPGNGHVPGCKGEMMSTHPATFAILDEIFVLLSAMKLRGAP